MFHCKNGFLQIAHSNVVDAVAILLIAPEVEPSDYTPVTSYGPICREFAWRKALSRRFLTSSVSPYNTRMRADKNGSQLRTVCKKFD